MSVVEVLYDKRLTRVEYRNHPLYVILDGDRAKQHSGVFRHLMDSNPGEVHFKVLVMGRSAPNLQGMRVVLEHVRDLEPGQTLKIPINNVGLPLAIQLHRACCYFEIEPPQTQIEGHMRGYLSHRIVSPADMMEVHRYYGNPDHNYHDIWHIMVHMIAYSIIKRNILADQQASLEAAARPHPLLFDGVNDKIKQLEQAFKYKALREAKKAAKDAADSEDQGGHW